MYIKEYKFDIEKISDLILEEIELLMEEKISVANDFQIMKEQFGRVIELKKKLNLETIDFVFVWKNKGYDEFFNKESYKLELAEIYNRLNYKITNSKKISTFMRGKVPATPSFHFPGGLNVWVLTEKNFTNSKIQPLVVVNFGIDGLKNFLDRMPDKIKDIMKYYPIEINNFFNYDQHVADAWSKK